MSFNPDPQKQAVELIFSTRKANHPIILFNNLPMMQVVEHKHLGIVLEQKLSFSTHIKSAISKTRKGIGMMSFPSNYLVSQKKRNRFDQGQRKEFGSNQTKIFFKIILDS